MKLLNQKRGQRYNNLSEVGVKVGRDSTNNRRPTSSTAATIINAVKKQSVAAFNSLRGAEDDDEETNLLEDDDNSQATSLDDEYHSSRFATENETDGKEFTIYQKGPISGLGSKNGIMVPYKQNCIDMRNVHKSYGSGKNKLNVLSGIDMTVPTGAIYGLLGPSGCGKTTLLRIIIGQLGFEAGHVTVFGSLPGDRCKGIPGERVGYMPQETALYQEFTILETMNYFGRIHNMPFSDIKKRMKFLLEFLHLPKDTRFIKNMSGGQKRRVSFAVALLHEPPLLILDEPTVGVDPLLRRAIWNHLVSISKSSNTTVIITTHYIEEARQANVVGLMRGGTLLAEAPPNTLLQRYPQCYTLEDVFLHLCMAIESGQSAEDIKANTERAPIEAANTDQQNTDVTGSTVSVNNGAFNASTEILVSDEPKAKVPGYHKQMFQHGCAYKVISSNKSVAMITKNFIRMWRNVGTMIFQFIIPSIQIILFCLAIGHHPTDLDVGIVNYDNDSLAYGDLFLNALNPNYARQIKYETMDDAFAAVRKNDVWCVVYIPFNYTQNMLSRFYGCTDIEDEVIEGSKIRVWLDITSQQIAYTLRGELIKALHNFSTERLISNGLNPDIASLPMVFEDPIYGSSMSDPSFTEFMAPGIILSISYFMAVGLTALAFILERKEGLIDRTFASGVNTGELMIGHFITQFFVMSVQVGLALFFMIVVFDVPCRGPPMWMITLTMLQGCAGMSYGLLISAFCDEEHSAIMFALGSFYCNLLLSGIVWPVNGMPAYMRYVSYFLPQTLPTESMRALLSRGWGIQYPIVWQGFVVTIAWLVVFLIITTILMRRKR